MPEGKLDGPLWTLDRPRGWWARYVGCAWCVTHAIPCFVLSKP